ncbi:MAG: outer membrane protein assembly factor BamE [Rickettsia endosymbiont of Bryobia graminum]|nr:outer membrane protein assembly factor BamE [Rickettsia endosymbiont of Bryobia graminum]
MVPFIIRAASTISILLTLSNCQTIESRGQAIDDTMIPKLENKHLSKSEVEDLVGTPTIIPDYTSNTWYYVHRSLSRRAWFEPKVIEQKIVRITFDRNNITQEVIVLNNIHKNDLRIISECTKTYGTELNGLQKFVRNIGRFNKTTEGKKKKKK